MVWIDFTDCKVSFKGYDGADTKISVLYDGKPYMLKFPRKMPSNAQNPIRASYSNNPFSEYVSCHIIESVGLPVQATLIGKYREKIVVACEDFVENMGGDYQLQEFSKLENSFLSSDEIGSGRIPEISNLELIFDNHERLAAIRDIAKERYWDTFVVDALLGNFDRHAGNWGYLISKSTGDAKPAPIYDCGSCLYAQLDDEAIPNLIRDRAQIHNRVYNYPLAALKENGRKINYFDFINSLKHADCNAAVLRVFPKTNLREITEIIGGTPLMSDVRKEFLALMSKERYEKILMPAHEKLQASIRDVSVEKPVGLIKSKERDIRTEEKAKGGHRESHSVGKGDLER